MEHIFSFFISGISISLIEHFSNFASLLGLLFFRMFRFKEICIRNCPCCSSVHTFPPMFQSDTVHLLATQLCSFGSHLFMAIGYHKRARVANMLIHVTYVATHVRKKKCMTIILYITIFLASCLPHTENFIAL